MTTPDPFQPPAGGVPASYGAPATEAGWGAPPAPYGVPAAGQGWGMPPAPYGGGSVGTVRGTGACVLLFFVTFGIYGLYWYYAVHDEMKRHTGTGLGGGLALLIAFFVSIVSPFITSSEVGSLYARRGQAEPVSATTALWYAPGFLILVGPFVWFARTNGALNAYWRSVGAQG